MRGAARLSAMMENRGKSSKNWTPYGKGVVEWKWEVLGTKLKLKRIELNDQSGTRREENYLRGERECKGNVRENRRIEYKGNVREIAE